VATENANFLPEADFATWRVPDSGRDSEIGEGKARETLDTVSLDLDMGINEVVQRLACLTGI
jgi:hypothetical protein